METPRKTTTDPCAGLLEDLTSLEQEIFSEHTTIADSLQTPPTTTNPLLEKFATLSTSWSSVKASAKNWDSMQVQEDENDDDFSLGASTISTLSSQESVFDRLYRQGLDKSSRISSRRRRISSSFASPKKRLSYTPKITSISTKNTRKSLESSFRDNGSSLSDRKKSTGIPSVTKRKNRVVATSSNERQKNKNTSKSSKEITSVFDRLYKNERRQEKLWKAPPKPTPRQRPDARRKAQTATSTAQKGKKKIRISTSSRKLPQNSSPTAKPSPSNHTSSSTRTATTIAATSTGEDDCPYSQKQHQPKPLDSSKTPRRTNIPPAITPTHVEPKQLFDESPPPSLLHPRKKGRPATNTTATIPDNGGFFTLLEPLILRREASSVKSIRSSTPRIQNTVRIRASKSQTAACCIQCSWRIYVSKLRVACLSLQSWSVVSSLSTKQQIQAMTRAKQQLRTSASVRRKHNNMLEYQISHLCIHALVAPIIKLPAYLYVKAALQEAKLEQEGKLYLQAAQTIQRCWRRQGNTTLGNFPPQLPEEFLFEMQDLENDELLVSPEIEEEHLAGMQLSTEFGRKEKAGGTETTKGIGKSHRDFFFSFKSLQAEQDLFMVAPNDDENQERGNQLRKVTQNDLANIQSTHKKLEVCLKLPTQQQPKSPIYVESTIDESEDDSLIKDVSNLMGRAKRNSSQSEERQPLSQVQKEYGSLSSTIRKDLTDIQAANQELDTAILKSPSEVSPQETLSSMKADKEEKLPRKLPYPEELDLLNSLRTFESDEELLVTPRATSGDGEGEEIQQKSDAVNTEDLKYTNRQDLAMKEAIDDARNNVEQNCHSKNRDSSLQLPVDERNMRVNSCKVTELHVSVSAEEKVDIHLNGSPLSLETGERDEIFRSTVDLYDDEVKTPDATTCPVKHPPIIICQPEKVGEDITEEDVEEEHPPSPVKTPNRRILRRNMSSDAQTPIVNKTNMQNNDDNATNKKYREDEHKAAIMIQNCVRMSTLSSAFEQSSHPDQSRFRQALSKSAAARSSSLIPLGLDNTSWLDKEPSDAFQRWAGTTEQSSLVEKRAASLAIHNIVRAYLHGLRKHRRGRKATIIQRAFRSYQQKQEYRRELRAALVIQSSWNQHQILVKKRYFAIQIQGLYKMKSVKNKFQILKFAAIVIQSEWRRYSCTKKYIKTRFLASWLQRTCSRGHLQQKRFLALKSAVTSLQRIYRVNKTRELYILQTRQATRIQAAWKMSVAAKRRLLILYFTTKIQSFFRMRFACSKYQVLQMKVRVIQNVFRQYCEWKWHCCQQASSLQIQTQWRRFQAVQVWQRQCQGCLVLQRTYRMYFSKRRFQLVLASTLQIQTIWRRYHAMEVYWTQQISLLKVQTQWRKRVASRTWLKTRAAVICFQSGWRAHSKMKSFRLLLQSALVVQSKWRGLCQKRIFQCQLSSSIVLQSFARQFIASKHLSVSIYAAVQCETTVRRYLVQVRFERAKRACIRIQSARRRYLAVRKSSTRIQAVTRIQAGWRMAMAHKYLVNSIHCITTFQRVYRGHNQKSKYRSQRFTLIRIQAMVRLKKQHLVYTKKKKGAIVLQAAMRRTMAREWYLKAVYSALFLQKVARGAVCRRKFQLIQNSVCDLQALVRGRYHRLQYAKIRCNLVTLQRYGRGMVVSLRFARFKASSTIIQRFWRQWLWKRKQDCAVLLIQSVWRGYVEQMRLAESLSNKLIFIQACWRAAIVRTKYMTYRSSASMIQSSIRGYLVREEVRHKMLAVISVQRIWRGNRERELFQKNLEEKIKAATLLQGIWRMHKAYQYVITSKQRVTILQSFARQRLAARKIQYQVTSATKLQTAWRLLRVKRLLVVKRQQHQACVRIQTQRRMIKEFATFRLAREAAISIQSRFRGYSARLFTKRHLYSVAIIQSGWRSAQAREYYLCARVSVAMMQSLGRGVLARRKFTMLVESKQEERHLAATCIQAVWRMKQSREVFESTLNAAICIQKYWRCANAREYHLHARAAVTMVQSLIRGVAVRSIVSDWHRSAICLQRYWRGHYSYEEYRMRVESKLREAEVSQSQNGSFEQTTKAGPVYKSKRIPSIRVGYDQAEGDHVKRESALLLSENQTQQSQPFSPSALEVLQSLLHNSATQIQRVWRGSVARRMVISDRLVTSSSAIVAIILIQATWRGSLHRNKFTERRACAITIQALFRMTRELKMFWYVRLPTQQRITLDDAARKIQVAFFLWKMKLAVWQMQSNAIILQRCIRGQLVRSAARFALVHMNASIKNAAVLSFARLVAGNDPYFATTAVASDRAVSNAQISACIVIQSAARRMLAKRAVFFEHGIKFGSERCIDQTIIIEKDPSAAIIQTAFRVTRACHEMGSGKIQAAYRGLKARQSYLQRDEHSSFLSMQLLNASIQDQRIARGKLAQVEAGNRLLKLHKREKSMTDAVVVIQKIARGVFGRVEASRHQVAREKAQAVANTLARTKAVRCLYAANEREKALTNAAVLIQKRIRQILAKRDRRRKQNIAIEKSLQVHSMLLRRIEKSSKDAVEKLLTTSGVSSNVDVIPCIRRLANRVIIARQEAAKHSKEGMTEYASEIMQGSGFEEIKHFSSSNSVASVHDSDLSSHQQIIEKKPSTPKIGNLATPVRSNRAIFEEAPNITLGQLMPTIGKKVGADHATSNNPDKLAQRTGLALQAKELLMFGRKNKGSLTAPAPKEVEITEEQTAMNEAEDRPPRGDNKSNKNLLFGAISPIKKERDSNGWDWAEEW